MFRYLNTNKRGITLDFDSSLDLGNDTPSPLRERAGVRVSAHSDQPDGLARLRELCSTADVVVETFRPGHIRSLGVAYDDLVEANPGIVLVSITPFGQTGTWRDYQATDLVTYGASGQSYVNGSPDREPLKEPGDESVFQAGACAFLGAMTALAHRDLTGEGQHVDVSMQEAGASAFSPQILGAMHRGGPEKRGFDTTTAMQGRLRVAKRPARRHVGVHVALLRRSRYSLQPEVRNCCCPTRAR